MADTTLSSGEAQVERQCVLISYLSVAVTTHHDQGSYRGRIYWGSWFREFKWWAWRLELRAHVLTYRHEIESELEMTLSL